MLIVLIFSKSYYDPHYFGIIDPNMVQIWVLSLCIHCFSKGIIKTYGFEDAGTDSNIVLLTCTYPIAQAFVTLLA